MTNKTKVLLLSGGIGHKVYFDKDNKMHLRYQRNMPMSHEFEIEDIHLENNKLMFFGTARSFHIGIRSTTVYHQADLPGFIGII